MTVLWVEPTGLHKAVVTAAIEAGADAVVAEARVASGLARIALLRRDGDALRGEGIDAPIVRITTPEDQAAARARLGRARTMVVETTDWRVIPLENLVAWARGTGTDVIAAVASADEARLALETLERGVQGILLRTSDPDEVRKTCDVVRSLAGERVALVEAEVTAVRPLRLGDRVCVDTVALLAPTEGLLVGSAASFLFLVGSEAADSGYVAARPFRVNAGAVHAYVRVPGGATRYLAELAAGAEVFVVDAEGGGRAVAVGRCKTEKRPLLLIHARAGDAEGSIVVQNAETIKLLTPKGPRSVASIEPGERVFVLRGGPARHFGVAVDESIREA